MDPIDAVFTSVAAGRLLAEALAQHGVHRDYFWGRLRRDELLQARWLKAKADRLSVRGSEPRDDVLIAMRRRVGERAAACRSAVRGCFDELLDRLRAGESVRHACAAMAIKRYVVKRLIADDAELERRYIAALREGESKRRKFFAENVKPTRPRIFNADRGRYLHLDDVLALVRQGMSLAAACASRPEFPSRKQFDYEVRRDPELKRRYLEASPLLNHRPYQRLTEEKFRGILTAVSDGLTLKAACRRLDVLPKTLHRRLDVAPEWRRRWLDTKQQRTGQLVRARNLVELESAVTAPAIVRHDEALGNELWARIRAVLPPGLDADVRQDVTSDMALAIFDGRLSIRDVNRESAAEFIRNHQRMFSPFRSVSLDKSVHSDSNSKLVDLLSTDRW